MVAARDSYWFFPLISKPAIILSCKSTPKIDKGKLRDSTRTTTACKATKKEWTRPDHTKSYNKCNNLIVHPSSGLGGAVTHFRESKRLDQSAAKRRGRSFPSLIKRTKQIGLRCTFSYQTGFKRLRHRPGTMTFLNLQHFPITTKWIPTRP